jgi:hypothetical protein
VEHIDPSVHITKKGNNMPFHPLPPQQCSLTPEQLAAQLRQDIRFQGFALRHGTGNKQPNWAYTAGLFRPASIDTDPRPELLISGLPMEAHVQWLLTIGFQIQGPPSRKAQEAEKAFFTQHPSSRDKPAIYPPGGRQFEPGRVYRDVATKNLPLCFGEVEPRYYAEYVPQTRVYYTHSLFPLYQVVWSDAYGYFPWDWCFDPALKGRQRILFDPARYLPLREDVEEKGV